MFEIIERLRVAPASWQDEQLLAAHKAGKAPAIFFAGAADIDWLPADTPQERIAQPLRPLLNNAEMSAKTGSKIETFDLAQLPYDSATRSAFNSFTEREKTERQARAYDLFAHLPPKERTLLANRLSYKRSQMFVGFHIPVQDAPESLKATANRGDGPLLFNGGYFISTEKLRRTTLNLVQERSGLVDRYIGFVPNTGDLDLNSQQHELTHARQRTFPGQRSIADEYCLESDADSNGMCEYLNMGGKPAVAFARLAARATSFVFMRNGHDGLQYGFFPMLLGRDSNWNLEQAHIVQTDLLIRMGNIAAGTKFAPQPEAQRNNIQLALANKPVSDRSFIAAVAAFNQAIKAPAYNLGTPQLLEKLWHSGAKLHCDTLRVAGIAYEALNLFRNGPSAY